MRVGDGGVLCPEGGIAPASGRAQESGSLSGKVAAAVFVYLLYSCAAHY